MTISNYRFKNALAIACLQESHNSYYWHKVRFSFSLLHIINTVKLLNLMHKQQGL